MLELLFQHPVVIRFNLHERQIAVAAVNPDIEAAAFALKKNQIILRGITIAQKIPLRPFAACHRGFISQIILQDEPEQGHGFFDRRPVQAGVP